MKKFVLQILLFLMFIPFSVNAKTHLAVGDYIYMVPDAKTYTISKSVTGWESNQTIKPNELTLWRVICINQDGTIDAISEYTSSESIGFQGTTGYSRFIDGLQKLAFTYRKEDYTQSSRIMGYAGQTSIVYNTTAINGTVAPSTISTPNSSNLGEEYENGLLGDTLYVNDYQLVNNVYKTEPSQYSYNGLKAYKVNDITSASNYWIASRYYKYSNPNFDFNVRYINNSGTLSFNTLQSNTISFGRYSRAIRPIITLRSDIRILDGEGTKSIPYNLRKRGNGNILVQNDNTKGQVEIDKQENIDEDDNVSFSVINENGYKLSNIIITDQNGTIIDYYYNEGNYSFSMPKSNVSITTVYEKVKNSINIEVNNKTEDLNIEINDMTQVEYDERVKFNVTPIKGYKVTNIKIIDKDNNEIEYKTVDNKDYIFTMPASDVTIIPSYERVSNAVNFEENKNTKKIVIEVNDSKAVVYEDKVKFMVEPVEGYEVESIDIVDKENNKINYRTTEKENEYEFTMPDTDVVITPIYKKIELIDVPNTIKNPNTGTGMYVIISIIVLVFSSSIYLIMKKKKNYIIK